MITACTTIFLTIDSNFSTDSDVSSFVLSESEGSYSYIHGKTGWRFFWCECLAILNGLCPASLIILFGISKTHNKLASKNSTVNSWDCSTATVLDATPVTRQTILELDVPCMLLHNGLYLLFPLQSQIKTSSVSRRRSKLFAQMFWNISFSGKQGQMLLAWPEDDQTIHQWETPHLTLGNCQNVL